METLVEIRPASVAELEAAPNLAELLAEYGLESAVEELRPVQVQIDTYRHLEANGTLKVLCAYQGAALIGFALLLISTVPHFGKRVATTESFFVAQAARSTGAGLRFLTAAEKLAREDGAMGLFVSAPAGSRLADVLDAKHDWRETNRVFFHLL